MWLDGIVPYHTIPKRVYQRGDFCALTSTCRRPPVAHYPALPGIIYEYSVLSSRLGTGKSGCLALAKHEIPMHAQTYDAIILLTHQYEHEYADVPGTRSPHVCGGSSTPSPPPSGRKSNRILLGRLLLQLRHLRSWLPIREPPRLSYRERFKCGLSHEIINIWQVSRANTST